MNIAVILSGGTGTRVRSGIPKQYIETKGRTMIGDCLYAFFAHPLIDAVQVVAHETWHAFIEKQALAAHRKAFDRRSAPRRGKDVPDGMTPAKLRGFSVPGEIRALSIVNALRDLNSDTDAEDIVIIHDAARPFVSEDLITRLIESCVRHEGSMPVLPMKDTVYLGTKDGTRVEKLLDRKRVVAGQTPEAFRFGKYLAANEALMPERILQVKGSTEVAVLAGMDVALIEGEESDYKITSVDDLERYREAVMREESTP